MLWASNVLVILNRTGGDKFRDGAVAKRYYRMTP